MRAKKSYGQHFLTNEDIAQQIADALTLDDGPLVPNSLRDRKVDGEPIKVIEIGPGKGFLTKYLLDKNIDLKVVEADQDMVDFLHLNYVQLHGRVIAEDFLKLDLKSIFPNNQQPATSLTGAKSRTDRLEKQQFSIIGNFPYNISSQIVFKMIEHREFIPELVGMFQKEMAKRIIASPGGKDYGVISVLTQAHYEGEYLFSVENIHFDPPPKVQSGVIRLRRKAGSLGCDEKLFRRIVKQVFSQRRKMLRNTLKPFFDGEMLMNDPYFTKRPEVLSVEEFVELANKAE
ncbi:MAG: 16S rRNA (adenine(1518)-N(6)/adenine(1519)-N(6))-dimethyltransferase RsmA [Bacteroidota bacterium]